MQTNILWTGREYYSLENCVVTVRETGTDVNSVIIGRYDNKIYRVEYLIKTNALWETVFFEIKTQLSDQRELISCHGDGKGNWTRNGQTMNEFKGCIDVDIPLTPFTNTLPIRRLKLPVQESKQIKVLYLDMLNEQIKPVTQKYTRLSQTEYQYENVPNDFEATITVDESGLVVDYPELFVRTARVESHYP
jgi:uncharacterized protein